MNSEQLKALISRLEGPGKVAEALSTPHRPLTQPAVSNWIARGSVPAERCVALATMAGIDPHVLRPDVFPVPAQKRKAG